MLLLKMLWHNIQYRAQRVRDEETGAINTVEIVVLVGLVVLLAAAVYAILQRKVSERAENVNLG